MSTLFIHWANRIYISRSCFDLPTDAKVNFTYAHKNGKETTKFNVMTLEDAILLAERRREDGRYKNYTFIID